MADEHLYPLPTQFKVDIDGVEVEDKYNLSMNFYHKSDGDRPSLYYRGKRVTKQWSINLIHHQPQDTNGASA